MTLQDEPLWLLNHSDQLWELHGIRARLCYGQWRYRVKINTCNGIKSCGGIKAFPFELM